MRDHAATRHPRTARGFPGARRPGASDLRRARRGFTLIELLIVIAIIGIIAALLVPSLLDALQKAKQKRTMGDIKIVGTSMMSWLTDQAGAAAAAGQAQQIDVTKIQKSSAKTLTDVLVPQYIQEIPADDAWFTPIEYRLDQGDPHGVLVFSIRSLGRDGIAQGSTYTVGSFDPTDYDQDLVWVDGGFVRWPQKRGP